MGIDIRAGFLAAQLAFDPDSAEWFRDRLAAINEVLVENGLPAHVEPEKLPELTRHACVGTARDWGWRLKRAYACFKEKVPLRTGELTSADEDLLTEATLSHLESHLLNHATDKGFFVPIDLPDGPLCDDRIPGGGQLGSTQRLLKELRQLAPALGLELQGDALSEASLALLAGDLNHHPLGGELTVWHQYFEEALLSLEHRSVIVIG